MIKAGYMRLYVCGFWKLLAACGNSNLASIDTRINLLSLSSVATLSPLSLLLTPHPSFSSLLNMPLNYSKWDKLEVSRLFVLCRRCMMSIVYPDVQVSDDSDIEGHPNVDHKSLVR